jgi:glycosyltransferase involved in cell wall biosynthesis
MKIAFFCDTFRPTRNGVAVSVASTAEVLRARGHRVVIFAPRYKGFVEADPDVVRFPAGHWFNTRDYPVAWPVIPYLSLLELTNFRREHFDIVHTHSPFILGMLGARWARLGSIPVVFTFHTLYHRYLHYSPLPPGLSRRYIVAQVQRYCHLCDHIIAPSESIARVVQRFRPGVPKTVLPTGVDVQRFAGGSRQSGRARYGIAQDEIVLLYVGRLAYEKNLGFLIRAIAPLLRGDHATGRGGDGVSAPTQPRIRLMLVGGGPASPSLQTLAEQLGVARNVIFTGFVDAAALPDHYAAADIFTFASRTETQGVCIAEALAAGLPCVLIGARGAAEAITPGQEGLVVPPNEERFREAVTTLVKDHDLRICMAARARAKAPSLSLERRVDALLNLYREIKSR